MKKFILALAVSYLIFFDSNSQSTSPFSIEEVLSNSFPTGLVTSAKGSKLTWVQNEEGVRNIWFAQAPDYEGQQLTNYQRDDGQEIGNLQFTADEKTIVFVHGSNPNRKGEFPNPAIIIESVGQQIKTLDIASKTITEIGEGKSQRVSPVENVIVYINKGQIWYKNLDDDLEEMQLFTIRGGASNLRWSPDGSKMAFVSNRGDHNFIGVYNFASKNLIYLSPSVDLDNGPVWSPDGSKIAFVRIPNERNRLIFEPHRTGLPWSIRIADVTNGNSSQLWQADKGRGSVFRQIESENQIFWAGDHIVFPWEKYGWTNLFSISAKTKEVKRLTDGEFEVQFVGMAPGSSDIYYSSNQDDIDRQHIWRSPVSGGTSTQLTSGDGVEWRPVPMNNGALASLASNPTEPASAVVWNGPKSTPLIRKSRRYPSKFLVKPEKVVFSSTDGIPIHGQLFKPKDYDGNRKYPAVLFFHGGSRRQMLLSYHHRGYYHNAYALNQYLASQGYLVLSVNYRSGIGYGMEFREALNYGATGASEFNDVMGAGLYLRNRSDVIPDKIGLWGGSYGGYLTAMGLARASDLFAAGVDIHGVHDWNVIINGFMPAYNPNSREDFAKLAFDSSPMAFIDTWKSPVLLIHGDDDRNVPFSETVDIAESLRRQRVEFEQLIFPDEVHGFLLHQNWVDAYKATTEFFDRKLK